MHEGSNVTVSKVVPSTVPPRRLGQKLIVISSVSSENDLSPCVSNAEAEAEANAVAAAAETRAGTLTEPLRMSERNVHRPKYEEMDGGREDESESDSEKESRATKGCLASTDKGNNGTVSEGVSSAELPRRMKRKATAMSSSRSDYDEAEGTEGCKFQKRRKARGP